MSVISEIAEINPKVQKLISVISEITKILVVILEIADMNFAISVMIVIVLKFYAAGHEFRTHLTFHV